MGAIRLIRCVEGEAVHLPTDGPGHSESFGLLYDADKIARDTIAQHDGEDHKTARELGAGRKKNARVWRTYATQ